jgi:hypothetical protein
MHLDALDHEVLSFEIISGPSSLTERVGIEQEDFVTFDEVGHKVFCRRALNGQFLDPRSLTKIFQAAIGKNVQRAQTLSYLVHGLEKVLVLFLKGLVELEEVWTLDVPVCKVRLCHQGIRIGQHGLKAFDHCIGLLLCRCLCAHNGQQRIPPISSLRNFAIPCFVLAMAKTLCDWSKRDISKHVDKLLELVDPPRFFCRKCARVANISKVLCKPSRLPRKNQAARVDSPPAREDRASETEGVT